MRTIVIWKQSFVELWDWIIIIFKTTMGPKSFSRFHKIITNLYIFSPIWIFRSYWFVYDIISLIAKCLFSDWSKTREMWISELVKTWHEQVNILWYWNFDTTLNIFGPIVHHHSAGPWPRAKCQSLCVVSHVCKWELECEMG